MGDYASVAAMLDARDQTISTLLRELATATERITDLEEQREVVGNKVEALQAEIAVDDQLLADYKLVLDACPCPVHGTCVPYVLEVLKGDKPLPKPTPVNAVNKSCPHCHIFRATLRATHQGTVIECLNCGHVGKVSDFYRRMRDCGQERP